MFKPTSFLFLFSCLHQGTNVPILMDAKQYALILSLSASYVSYIFDNIRTTLWVYHHQNNHRYHAIFLFAVVSQTNQEHNAKRKGLSTLLYYISCILRGSGICTSCHGSSWIASIHISLVLKWSGTRKNAPGLILIISLHISCVLNWSRTWSNADDSMHTTH